VQITVGRVDRQLFPAKTAQHGLNGGRFRVPHIGVADQADIGAQLVGMRLKEARQTGAARLLLTLEQNRCRDGKLAGNGLPCPAGLDESHDLSLVIGGAPRANCARSVRALFDERLEGIVIPELDGIDRLHIVVPVEQDRSTG